MYATDIFKEIHLIWDITLTTIWINFSCLFAIATLLVGARKKSTRGRGKFVHLIALLLQLLVLPAVGNTAHKPAGVDIHSSVTCTCALTTDNFTSLSNSCLGRYLSKTSDIDMYCTSNERLFLLFIAVNATVCLLLQLSAEANVIVGVYV